MSTQKRPYFFHNKDQCTTDVYRKSDGSCACGLLLESDLTWIEAFDACISIGARLPEVMSEEDNQDIYNLTVFILFFQLVIETALSN